MIGIYSTVTYYVFNNSSTCSAKHAYQTIVRVLHVYMELCACNVYDSCCRIWWRVRLQPVSKWR